jgi:peptidoglycan/xylan/chitin deacetylase (PgdA/CDA1 family)
MIANMTFNFHGVGPISRSLGPGESNCWLESDIFEAIIDIIKEFPNTAITVDDGNRSDFTHILPLILKRGIRAKFFICTDRLDHPAFLTRYQIRSLLGAGMEIGSHGVGHRSWGDISANELTEEVESSRRILEELCKVPVDEAACPYGTYDRRVLSALRRARYRRVYTSDGGISPQGSWMVPRTTITRQMSIDMIRRLVMTGPSVGTQMLIHVKRFTKALI